MHATLVAALLRQRGSVLLVWLGDKLDLDVPFDTESTAVAIRIL